VRFRSSLLLLGLLLLVACTGGGTSSQPSGSPHASPSPSQTSVPTVRPSATPSLALKDPGPLNLRWQQVAGGLVAPWELVFLPDGRALISERPGRIRLLDSAGLKSDPLLSLRVSAVGESGLLGMVLHPHYPSSPFLYVYYTYRSDQGPTNKVVRFTLQDAVGAGLTLTAEQVILDGIAGDGGCCHFGGRIKFGPDGYLYVTTGEAYHPQRSPDLKSLNGKILRITDSGQPPADNPIPGSPVYASGFRNPQGLAWDSGQRLYVSDNGPTGEFGFCCHDEVNLIQPGGYYGWPAYAGNTSTGQAGGSNPIPPILESGSDVAWAPSGATFYTPSADERPTLVVATLKGTALRRVFLDPAQPDKVLKTEALLSDHGRLRDAVANPADHCLYVLTSNRDNRGSPQAGDDQVLKGCPL